ncbi:hypothetical protein PM082_018498 [Marasmius tenuissimus]|nr:hypothetical protein PM082_018498 [Marasmius tenuissimus]
MPIPQHGPPPSFYYAHQSHNPDVCCSNASEPTAEYSTPPTQKTLNPTLHMQGVVVEFKDAHDLVPLSVTTLDWHMHDSVRVHQVLESGSVKSALLADQRYFEMDGKHKTNVEGRFAEWAAKVVDNMARYSVYPVVLRQFIRFSRRDEVKPGNLVEKGSTLPCFTTYGK